MAETYQGLAVWATVGRCHTGQPPEAPACRCITAAARKIRPSHCSVLPCRREGSDSSTTAKATRWWRATLRRMRAPARGPAAAPSITARREELKEGKRKGACGGTEPLPMSCSAGHRRRSQQEEEERNAWPCVADSLPWRGGERPPSATAAPRAEKNGMATRVFGAAGRFAGFDPAEDAGQPSDADQRSGAPRSCRPSQGALGRAHAVKRAGLPAQAGAQRANRAEQTKVGRAYGSAKHSKHI